MKKKKKNKFVLQVIILRVISYWRAAENTHDFKTPEQWMRYDVIDHMTIA